MKYIAYKHIVDNTIIPALASIPANVSHNQAIYWFEGNSYGASVIRQFGSYGAEQGLYELAVIKRETKSDYNDWKIDYTTPITNDVLGYLTEDQVEAILDKIALLEDK